MIEHLVLLRCLMAWLLASSLVALWHVLLALWRRVD